MNNLPTQITIRTCQEDGGTVAGCIHYSYAGETIDSMELAHRQQDAQVDRARLDRGGNP